MPFGFGVEQNGSLAVPAGREIVSTINDLLELPFVVKIATKDWHPADHVSFASNHATPENVPFVSTTVVRNPYNASESYTTRLWPVHCVQDTPGAQLIPELHIDRIDHVVEKGQDARVEMYSAFTDPFVRPSVSTSPLAALLREADISHVFIVGLALDYCVRFTALDSRKEGFRTYVVREATRAVDSGEAGRGATEHAFEDGGVHLVDLDGEELHRVRASAKKS